MKKDLLSYFVRVELPNPVDIVIDLIGKLIKDGIVNPGDRLPSEKRIEDRMQVPRGAITTAFRRLEAYGVVRTVAQSGTYVADLSRDALIGLISNLTAMDVKDYEHVSEIRCLLEEHAVRLVALNATNAELNELKELQQSINDSITSGNLRFDEDIVFHLKIAACSKNLALRSILTKLAVDSMAKLETIRQKIDLRFTKERLEAGIREHNEILDRLIARDAEGAVKKVREHYSNSRAFRNKHLSQ